MRKPSVLVLDTRLVALLSDGTKRAGLVLLWPLSLDIPLPLLLRVDLNLVLKS